MSFKSFRSVVRGVGSALPERVVSNAELAAKVDTSDEWIQQRTGIRQRYIAGEGETSSTLGTRAAARALARAGIVTTAEATVGLVEDPYSVQPS